MNNDRPGPPGSVTHEDGSRFYEIGGERYWSVTTALHILAKDGLTWWAAGLAADAVFADLPKVALASITQPCGNTHSRCKGGADGHDWRVTCPSCPCTRCQACVREWLRRLHVVKRDDRADEGIRTHDWIEHWVLSGGQHAPIHDDIAPYVRAFLAFVQGYGLSPDSWLFTEATVVNRAEKYAGTTDGGIRFWAGVQTDLSDQLVARVLGVPVSQAKADNLHADLIFDTKTKTELPEGKSIKVYPSVALQMGGYWHAPTIVLKGTGQEVPMPPLHGALALQLYPDLAVPRLCVVDEMTYAAFLNALSLYRWYVEFGSASTSEKSFPLPPEPKQPPMQEVKQEVGKATVKAPGTRAPRKTAAKTAASDQQDPTAEERAAARTETAAARARAHAAAKSSATIASMLTTGPDTLSTGEKIPF